MSIHSRVERIEQELGIVPDQTLPPLSMVASFAIRWVARQVCLEWGVEMEDVLSDRREDGRLFAPRAAISWLAHKRLGRGSYVIGQMMNRHHSTIIHQIAQACAMIQSNADFRARLDAISRRLFERGVE